MTKFVLTDATVIIDSVDLSDHVKSVTLNYAAELEDDTVMGDDTRSRTGGLKDWSIDIEFAQDFEANKVDVTLFALVGTTFPIIVGSSSATVSATHPEFTGTGILESYPTIGNAVGELATTTITVQSAGTLTRDVTP